MRPVRRWLGWLRRKTIRRCQNEERNNDGTRAQMCSLMLSHWEGAFRERESLVEVVETAGLVFEHLSPLHSPLCLQREENG